MTSSIINDYINDVLLKEDYISLSLLLKIFDERLYINYIDGAPNTLLKNIPLLDCHAIFFNNNIKMNIDDYSDFRFKNMKSYQDKIYSYLYMPRYN